MASKPNLSSKGFGTGADQTVPFAKILIPFALYFSGNECLLSKFRQPSCLIDASKSQYMDVLIFALIRFD